MPFQIIKENSSDIWRHSDTTLPNDDLILSTGFFKFTGDTHELFSSSGGQLRVATLSNIEVIDETDTGTPETFTTSLNLITRLKALGYPYFNEAAAAGAVSSVFGRTGAVTAAVADYTGSQVNNTSIVAGSTVSDALNTLSGQVTGFVTASGTPLNNQFAVWVSDTEVEGIPAMTYDGTDFIMGDANGILTLKGTTGLSEIFSSNRFDFETANGVRFNNVGKTRAVTFLYPASGLVTLTSPSISGTIALTSDLPDVNEWSNSSGTRAGGDLIVDLGDYDASGNGTKITINDATQKIEFTSELVLPSNLLFNIGSGNIEYVSVSNKLKLEANTGGFIVLQETGSSEGILDVSNLTADRTFTFPDNTGTIALTSDLGFSEWSTYTGTRVGGDLVVTLGDYTNNFNSIKMDVAGGTTQFYSDGGVAMQIEVDNTYNYNDVFFESGRAGLKDPTSNFYGTFRVLDNSLTANRNLDLPDASGTLALTSDITVPDLQAVTDAGNSTTNGIDIVNNAATYFQATNVAVTDGFYAGTDGSLGVYTGAKAVDISTGGSAQISLTNAGGNTTTLTETATANRAISFPDAAGTLIVSGGLTDNQVLVASGVSSADGDSEFTYDGNVLTVGGGFNGTMTLTDTTGIAFFDFQSYVEINSNEGIRLRNFGGANYHSITSQAGSTGLTAELQNSSGTVAWLDDTKDGYLEQGGVNTTFNLDYAAYKTWDLTLTGATTLTESNLPTSGTYSQVITIYCTGNFALTFPAAWNTNIIGTYDGTVLNQIVVEYRKASTYFVTINQPD